MKKIILIFVVSCITILSIWFLLNNSRIGVGIRVLFQMIISPDGLYENKTEVQINSDVLYYEIIVTNSFVGCYAIRINVPVNPNERTLSSIEPPSILNVKYLWKDGMFMQSPCRRSWYSLGESSSSFAYESVLVPIDVPQNQKIKVQVQFSKESQCFFREHPGSLLIFGKDSDE